MSRIPWYSLVMLSAAVAVTGYITAIFWVNGSFMIGNASCLHPIVFTKQTPICSGQISPLVLLGGAWMSVIALGVLVYYLVTEAWEARPSDHEIRRPKNCD